MSGTFRLLDTATIDARRGFSRWIQPGRDVYLGSGPRIRLDLWNDRDGRLLVRFTCWSGGYRHLDEFEIISTNTLGLAEADVQAVVDWLDDKVVKWTVYDFEAEAVWDDFRARQVGRRKKKR